jgi:hypothetical protein
MSELTIPVFRIISHLDSAQSQGYSLRGCVARNVDLDITPFPTSQRNSDTARAMPAFERAMRSNQKDFE